MPCLELSYVLYSDWMFHCRGWLSIKSSTIIVVISLFNSKYQLVTACALRRELILVAAAISCPPCVRPGPEEPRAHIIGGSGGIPNGRYSRRNHEPLWNSEEEHLLTEPRNTHRWRRHSKTVNSTQRKIFRLLGRRLEKKAGQGN